MTQMIPAPPGPTTNVALRTVGVEPMTAALRAASLDHIRNARSAVLMRDGDDVRVISTDNDPDRRVPLDHLAMAYAAAWGARLTEPQWAECEWCGDPDPLCEDRDGHALLHHQSEHTWRR